MITSFVADYESSYIVILALPKIFLSALSSWKEFLAMPVSYPPWKAALFEEIKTNVAELFTNTKR